jgi:methionyl-tRNA formyltransferase
MKPVRIVFAGTPEFAVPSLAALIQAPMRPLDLPAIQVVGVYTQPDRPAGRGRQIQSSPVKALALAHELPVHQPTSLKSDPNALLELNRLAADLMVVVAYGLILPPAVLESPRLGCINVHASLLPRWRGAAPIQRAVLAGDAETGVCIMRMDTGLDTGPVHHRVRTPIGPEESAGELQERLAALGADALLDALPDILGGVPPEPQPTEGVTYAHKLSKEDALIAWSDPATQIARAVRAFAPWPVAHTALDGDPVRIWAATAEPAANPSAAPGTVLGTTKDGIRVATGDGVLRISRLQPAGKRPMAAADFINARSLDGVRLG